MVSCKKMNKIFLLIALSMIFLFSGTIFAEAKAKSVVKPQLKINKYPAKEYKAGDRVSLEISAPNYSEKVQYRVILWDGNKNQQRELWPTMPGYYYTKWTPSGKTNFTIGWPISEPGAYSLTVLVKRYGAKVPYDSYVKTNSFIVKPKDVSKNDMSDEKKLNEGILDKEGAVYGTADEKNPLVINKDVKITVKDVTLSNTNIQGNLYISSDNANLNNVAIKGTVFVDPGEKGEANLNNLTAESIIVLSGGQDSIHLNNVKTNSLEVESKNAVNPVRIETKGETSINNTIVNSNAILDSVNGYFGNIEISKKASTQNIVELRGKYEKSIIVSGQAVIKAGSNSDISKIEILPQDKESVIKLEGVFKAVEVNKEAKIVIAEGSKIETAKVNAKAEISLLKDSTIESLNNTVKEVNVTGEGKVVETVNAENQTPQIPGGAGGAIPPIVNPVEEKLMIKSVAANTSSGEMPFTQISDTEYSIDLSNLSGDKKVSGVSLTSSKDSTLTVKFTAGIKGIDETVTRMAVFKLKANTQKQIYLSDFNLPDNNNDGIALSTLRNLENISFNITLSDEASSNLNINLRLSL